MNVSLDAIQPAGQAVGAVTHQLVAGPFSASRTDQTQRASPRIAGHLLRTRIFGEVAQTRRTSALVIGEVGIHRLPCVEQCGARLPHPCSTSLAHRDGDEQAQKTCHDEHAPQAVYAQPSTQPSPSLPRKEDVLLEQSSTA